MTVKNIILAGTIVLGFAMLVLAGCAGRSQSARFYVLSPVADADKTANQVFSRDISIGIPPVSLPKYLKKAQIASRTGNNELHLEEYHRWAGKLEEDIGRVIVENLGLILATDQVLSYPAMTEINPDYAIKIDISRFDGRLGGDIEFIARWAIFDRNDKPVYGVRASRLTEPSNGGSYAEMVAAQSRILAAFSRELAQALMELADG